MNELVSFLTTDDRNCARICMRFKVAQPRRGSPGERTNVKEAQTWESTISDPLCSNCALPPQFFKFCFSCSAKILIVDADDTLSPNLSLDIQTFISYQILQTPRPLGLYFKFINNIILPLLNASSGRKTNLIYCDTCSNFHSPTMCR